MGAASPGDGAREKLRWRSAILDATPDPSLPFFKIRSSFCWGMLLKKLPAGDRGRGETVGKVGVKRVKEGVLSAVFTVVELFERTGLDGRDSHSCSSWSVSLISPSGSESFVLLDTGILSSSADAEFEIASRGNEGEIVALGF